MTVLTKDPSPAYRQHRPKGDVPGMDPCGGWYVQDCSCSWRGSVHRREVDAVEAWAQHAHGGWTVQEQAARRRWRQPAPLVPVRRGVVQTRRPITGHPLWRKLTRRTAA